jgi:hypothetical protein
VWRFREFGEVCDILRTAVDTAFVWAIEVVNSNSKRGKTWLFPQKRHFRELN